MKTPAERQAYKLKLKALNESVLNKKPPGRPRSGKGWHHRDQTQYTEEESGWLAAINKYRFENSIRCMTGLDYLKLSKEYFKAVEEGRK